MKPAILMVDVDGVVVRPANPLGWSAEIERDLGIPAAALQSRFFQVHWADVIHGRAGLRERLAGVLAEIAPHVSCETLIRYWFHGDAELDANLLTQIATVRATGVAVHLATVQEHERAAWLWNDLGLRDHFDDMHYAADLGASKPSQAFYAAVEQRVGRRGSAIAFVDDSERNVQAARERGWQAALWTSGASLPTLLPALMHPSGEVV
ncbi:HAD family hydrolase [Brevundimonas subvibrioides]|uniref:HAD-superfamily hydrolase, subfamily IA, variant 3 n=1 Tax=Brevundimonas subvibrioides (strain ATCC 15264 / DSM 4735 / LMG 14903 / NBRC 16000 / CB 81) TaxID=633149 RepID=D9QNX5_BRESC|nr:HAD-IA family hydrolase [Brevundimonas subvibrioides]ADL00408.1 HAD-superfamily hydrolase, subfamily IA, variant 3 [Brevundimonas subvibrioides ATCC 15264]